jgi:RES domain-containing protein
MVYFAEHPALAALEVRVHLDLPFELLPVDYVLIQVTLPDNLIVTAAITSRDTAHLGDAWRAEAGSAALLVPSELMPNSWNVLLNPRHPDAGRAGIAAVEPFHFDPRLWQPMVGEGDATPRTSPRLIPRPSRAR